MKLIPNDDQLLHNPSLPVTEAQMADQCRELKPIAALLLQGINEYQALGISACQLGINMAMFAMDVDGQPRICINPSIVAATSEMYRQEEGCLSFPGLALKVNRPAEVVVRYHNMDGNEVTEHLSGLTARVWLHEYDHTIGVCFTDRVGKLSLNMAKKRLAKAQKRGKK
jgi:peptide deformylase